MVLRFSPLMVATPTVPVEFRDRYLWQGNKRFLVRGVVYQAYDNDDSSLAGRDMLQESRLPQLQHDVGLFKELGVNTIYIYAIDHTKDHSRAMKMLEDAGIHVLFVSLPTHLEFQLRLTISHLYHSISRTDPQASYKPDTLDVFFRKIDEMARFPNTLGFLIANSLINNISSEICAPVIRAVVRDLKKYMKLKHQATGQRTLPVGFGGGQYDGDVKVLNYLTDGDESSSIDFWTCDGFASDRNLGKGLNRLDGLVVWYRNAKIPILLSEYGTNSGDPRTFHDAAKLYSPPLTAVFSGGCVYEFWQGSNRYGLVLLEPNNAMVVPGIPSLRKGADAIGETRQIDSGTLYIFKDFTNYKQRLAETRDVVASADDVPEPVHGAENWIDSLFGHKPSDDVVPESCVDWVEVERNIFA